ncbi:hypothetical protein KSP39_PZI019377 [Platanthera zijinensis]|uniref:GTD-binding domain-containing protein n=1 Tax=Platanthera zijinensis TaxID=2320716 RepID=A0AAP0B2L4_9ASPA
MACRAVQSWTLISLVGAYLDLLLAYLFIVGATAAFFASKLLSLFGLSLPCSCDGRFGHPTCAQTRLLIDFPTAKLAAVHRSLRSRFPFDSLLHAGASSSPVCRDDGDSCCSVSSLSAPPRALSISAPPLPADPTAEEPLALITGIHDDLISDQERILSVSISAEKISGDPWDSDSDGLGEEDEPGREEKKWLSAVVGCDKGANLLDRMRRLAMELEEERGARAALYLDLEKERSAAASAADEAMSMILRLQKEKAEIDMESRQYHRMIEEKYTYDAEEMVILKEIIVMREREKHVLEKELQLYKQMVNSGGHVEQASDSDESFLKDKLDALVDASDDPLLMLQSIYDSIGQNEGFVEDSLPILNPSDARSSDRKFVGAKNHVKLFNNGDDCDREIQEKSMLPTLGKLSSSDMLTSICAENSVLSNVNPLFDAEYLKHVTDLTVRDEDEKVPTEVLFGVGSDDSDKRCSEFSQLKTESSILDVHVIDDDQVLLIKDDDNQNSINPEEDSSCINFDQVELSIRRSCSEISNRLSLIGNLSRRASYFDLRSSLPSVETERSKLENEVEGLRKRLDIIRKGRAKLRLYRDQKDKETFQLQLLDEIAGQLNEIRIATEPIKILRRVSSPPSPELKVKG